LDDCIKFVANHFLTIGSKRAQAAAKARSSRSASALAAASVPSQEHLVVMLLVDELSKSRCDDAILTMTGALLDSPPKFVDGRVCLVLPFFTSLSETRIREASTKSNRDISPLPLTVALTSAPAKLKAKLAMPRAFDCLIELLCRDVGYHGRMLEAIVSILSSGKLRRKVLDASHRPFAQLPHIHAALMESDLSVSFFTDLSSNRNFLVKAVCHALLAKSVNRELCAVPENFLGLESPGLTYDELLARGIFIGNAATKRDFITPVMSPLQLVAWADQCLSDGVLNERMLSFAKIVSRAFGSESSYNWETFELFNHGTFFFFVAEFYFRC
jgi:hypothetical protein